VLGVTIFALGLLVAAWVAHSIRRITDLSEAHERERRRAEQASEVKSRFLANMSHEMRTPLNGVLGLAEVLSRRRLDPESAGLVRSIGRSGRTLLALVNDILDLSRVQADQLELERAPFDAEAAAVAVCEMVKPQARTKGIDLAVRVDESLPRQLVGDRLRFEQVLTNLVGNAVKFTSEGSVSVQLQHADSTLRVEVADTGVGIAVDKHAAIFDAFAQADTSTTRLFGGSGLGLTIARRLARLMGGDIALDSAPGRGSRFTFTARLPPADASSTTRSSEILRPSASFVVCEHPASREALLEAARSLGGSAEAVSWALLLERLSATSEPGRLVVWDARVALEARVVRALRDAALARRARVVLVTALGEDAHVGVPCTSLGAPFTREAFARAAASEAKPRASLHDRPTALLSARLLVAEDDETNRLVVASYCAELGVQADVVADGIEALERVRSGARYDVVLMDCQMPRMDGYEATRRIRAWELEGARTPVPIVAVTAHALPGERARASAAGMNGYLTKPLTLDALRGALLEHVPAVSDAPAATDPPAIALLGTELGAHPPEVRSELAAAYRRGLDAALEGLGRSVEAERWDDVATHAHKLRGSSAAIGAHGVRDLAGKLEELARRGGGEAATGLVVELEVAAADTLVALEELG
jgi:CheY-like chemotaxis protein/nitrogen-specific signal transduction histidine kinase/HPt (histidine-containing phosphotransfer) domain-containing protein